MRIMNAISFSDKESLCEKLFLKLPPLYHVCTSENFEIIFTCEDDFIAGMNIFGICCKLFPKVRVYTFQLMSNHFHIIASGDLADINDFVEFFILRIHKYVQASGRRSSIEKIEAKCFPVNNLNYLRAAIAYVNRNGFVVNDSFSPYSYPWGANSCYFNNTMIEYYNCCRRKVTATNIRSLIRSKIGDDIKDLYMLGKCVSPLSYCEIKLGESAFRDEKHYFYSVSKNVESYGYIAKEIGEMMIYSDDDVYHIAMKYSTDKYGLKTPSLLKPDAKMELARVLQFEYHANKKQIQRILKLSGQNF